MLHIIHPLTSIARFIGVSLCSFLFLIFLLCCVPLIIMIISFILGPINIIHLPISLFFTFNELSLKFSIAILNCTLTVSLLKFIINSLPRIKLVIQKPTCVNKLINFSFSIALKLVVLETANFFSITFDNLCSYFAFIHVPSKWSIILKFAFEKPIMFVIFKSSNTSLTVRLLTICEGSLIHFILDIVKLFPFT